MFPPDLGGPATYVPSLGRFFVERGHEVRVLAFCSDPAPTGHPFEVETISRGSLPLRYLKAFWRVLRTAGWADVVYVQEHLALLVPYKLLCDSPETERTEPGEPCPASVEIVEERAPDPRFAALAQLKFD